MTDPQDRPSGGAVIVDDRLALFAALGWLPRESHVEIVTTYGDFAIWDPIEPT